MNTVHTDTEALDYIPAGYKAAGIYAGIKKSSGKKDMMMLCSDIAATGAGVFTKNKMRAAPVKISASRVPSAAIRAIVVNSGNANACTGTKGMDDANAMTSKAATELGLSAEQLLVCSTGHIGDPLPMDVINKGIETLANEISSNGFPNACEAILTTDTRRKCAAAEVSLNGTPVRIFGMCKGAGMIEPNMATMLGFVVTDAGLAPDDAQALLAESTQKSFNRISVDGDQSTNDTVLLLANGVSGKRLTPDHPDWQQVKDAVMAVCHSLAVQIVKDGEGAKKFVTVQVRGAKSASEADTAARAVANSMLVKTSWAGKSANWGRIADAIGYCGVDVDPNKLCISYDGLPACMNGCIAATSEDDLSAIIQNPAFTIEINLQLGPGEADIYTCECTEEYVRINVE